jgi:hypothetical protein
MKMIVENKEISVTAIQGGVQIILSREKADKTTEKIMVNLSHVEAISLATAIRETANR